MNESLHSRRSFARSVLAHVLIAAVLLPNAPARAQGSLKIMSYNIHGMAPNSDAPTRLYHIIQNLKQIDPDILGVQEINETLTGGGLDNQGKIIADSLSLFFGRPYYFYQSATHNAWNNAFLESIGIITKYPIEQSGYASLAVAEFPRKVVWSSIMTPLGRVNFFNTHLSNTSGATRFVQAGQIMQFVRAQELANPGVASILTGDFNDVPGSGPIQLLVGDGSDSTFDDTFREANPTLPGFTVPAGSPTSRIDFVFYLRSGQFTVEQSEVTFSQPYAPNLYPSDHHGVMSTFATQTTPKISAPSSIVFPSLLIDTRDSINLKISSASIVPLEIVSITNSDQVFRIIGVPPLPISLPQRGSALNLKIVFTPSTSGIFLDTIVIGSNDPVRPVRRVTVAGKAVARIEPAHSGALYATTAGQSEGGLHTIDPNSGVTASVGSLRIPKIHSLAIRPATEELYGAFAGPDGTVLYRITTNSGDAVRSLTIPVGNLRAIAFGADDTLYGATTSGGFYRIDIKTGNPMLIGTSPGHEYAGIAMNPLSRKLWACVSAEPDSTYEIDPWSGAARLVGATGYFALTRSLAFGPGGMLYALLDDGQNVCYIATLDNATASGIAVNPTGVNSMTAIAMSLKVPTSIAEEKKLGAPAAYCLYQNYPNPFNPSTKIQFTLVNRQSTILKVYDLIGQEVATLVNEVKGPGSYTVQLDGSNLPSGVYFYRLQAGGFVQAKKLVILR